MSTTGRSTIANVSDPDAPVASSHPPGWWQASDLQWYPPELHSDPEHRARHVTTIRPSPASDGQAPQSLFDLDPAPPLDPSVAAAFEPPRRLRATAALWGLGLVVLVGLVVAALVLAFQSDGDDPAVEPAAVPTESAQGAGEPDVTRPTSVGRPDQPADLGQVWGWPEWRGTVIDVIDTADTDLLDLDATPIAEGRSHVVVLYEATYLGDEVAAFEPFLVDAAGTTVHATNACLIGDDQLEQWGVARNRFELVPGQTARFADCIEVDTAAVPDLVVTLANVNVFASSVAYRSGGDALPELQPHGIDAGGRALPTEPLGTELGTAVWSGAVVDVLDVDAAGLLASFADPPREGHRYLAVVFTATNLTGQAGDFVPLRVTGLGREVYEPINGCWLDDAALNARGIGTDRSLAPPDQTVTLADCIEVPTDDVESLVIRLEDGLSAENAAVLYPVPDPLG